MKTTLLLIYIINLLDPCTFGQENYPLTDYKLRHDDFRPRIKFEERETSKRSSKLKIGDRDIPITTHDGQSPTEEQTKTIQNALVDDFLVNDDVTGGTTYQVSPTVAMDGIGNFVIVWVDDRNDYNIDIYYQRFNSDGGSTGVNTKANNDAGTEWQFSPSVSMDGSGNFVIVWMDEKNSNWDIYYQRYNNGGAAQGENTKVNQDAGTEWQSDPLVSMGDSGNFVIVWYDYRNGNEDIYYQQYNNSGAPQGVNTKANDDVGQAKQWYPSISMDGSGNFVIVWGDFRNGNEDIYYQLYNSSGTAQGVNTKANDDAGIEWQKKPSVSIDNSGNFVIVWEDQRNGHDDIYYQCYNSGGAAIGANTKVNDDAGTAYQWYPSISMNGSGNFVIVWEDYNSSVASPDIIGQRYFANGSPNGNNYRIVGDGPNHGERSPVVVANNTNIVFSWMDNRRSKGWDIYGKIVGWDWNGVTLVTQGNNLLSEFSLFQNYPNPFNPSTKITYAIPLLGGDERGGFVTLKIYDVLGNEVATLADEYKPAGSYEIDFNAANLPSGVYFYQLQAENFIETKKMLLLR